jgi:class 3 adenylate cyclase/tetratricopeptide (TPR) repeat protein
MTEPNAVAAYLRAAKQHDSKGEYFAAYDLVQKRLEKHPKSVILAHWAVLMLARVGATPQARALFRKKQLRAHPVPDTVALRARLARDMAALCGHSRQRDRWLRLALAIYRRAYCAKADFYAGINLAELLGQTGQTAEAQAVAATVAEGLLAQGLEASEAEQTFWRTASYAIACLICNNQAQARLNLDRVRTLGAKNLTWLATVRRSLKIIAAFEPQAAFALDIVPAPSLIHYVGHIVDAPGATTPRFPAEQQKAVRAAIADILEKFNVSEAYGSLAAGADILFAEEILKRPDAKLHVVLPMSKEEFLERSVRPSGGDWEARFRKCMKRAQKSELYATTEASLGHDALFSYGGQLAMGRALLNARMLDAEVRQIALWDGKPARGPSGTAHDVAAWRHSRRGQCVIGLPLGTTVSRSSPSSTSVTPKLDQRYPKAMLFGDFKGFSKLSDADIPKFVTEVMGVVADVVAKHSRERNFVNTWGDGLYVVYDSPRAAADFALALLARLRATNWALLGVVKPPILRLGGHLGPAYQMCDPVLKRDNFFGAHVSRAARIEPVAPDNSLYVTEHFAAALALDDHKHIYHCDYAGPVKTAKDYGPLRLFLLRHSVSATPAGRAS